MTRILTIALLGLLAVTPAYADDWSDCAQDIDHDLGIPACSRIITAGGGTNENLAIAYYDRGFHYSGQGDYARAIPDYDNAIQLKPDYAEAYGNRGGAYGSKGDYDRAIADLDKAIQLKPDYAEAIGNRGGAYVSKGDYDRAIADLDEAIQLKPGLAETYFNRGLLYSNTGDYDRAIADYRVAASLVPVSDSRHSLAVSRIAAIEAKLTQTERLASDPRLPYPIAKPPGGSARPAPTAAVQTGGNARLPRPRPNDVAGGWVDDIAAAAGGGAPEPLSAPAAAFAHPFLAGAPYEFLFTRDKVVSLTINHAEVSFADRFDKAALAAALPGYDLSQTSIEDWDAFIVSRAGEEYLTIGGYLQSGEIKYIWDILGAIDAHAATPGMAVTDVFRSTTAGCSVGISYYCDSEVSPSLSYVVEWDEECAVELPKDEEMETKLLDCMKIAGFEMSPPE